MKEGKQGLTESTWCLWFPRLVLPHQYCTNAQAFSTFSINQKVDLENIVWQFSLLSTEICFSQNENLSLIWHTYSPNHAQKCFLINPSSNHIWWLYTIHFDFEFD